MKELSGKIIEALPEGTNHSVFPMVRSLGALRELAGLSEEEMAQRLHLSPTEISKIELSSDIHVSHLRQYVKALGAELRIDEPNLDGVHSIWQLRDTLAENRRPRDQLVLPIFEDQLFRPQRDIIISIKPHYVENILMERKTVELRRRFPTSASPGTIAHIYSTSPVQAMVGCAEINDIVRLPITEIWRVYGKEALIDRKDFESYFTGLSEGVALKFTNVQQLPKQFNLSELRSRFGFEPPQSFLYAKPDLQGALHNAYAKVSN